MTQVVPSSIAVFVEPYSSLDELMETEPEDCEQWTDPLLQDRLRRLWELNVEVWFALRLSGCEVWLQIEAARRHTEEQLEGIMVAIDC